MSAGHLLYALAAASVFSTLIFTILNGLVFAALQSLFSNPSTGIAPLGLSAVNCVALIVTSLIVHKNVRHRSPWPYWKTCAFYATGIYLIIAAGSTAGTMGSPQTPSQTSLCVVRSIFWALSVFAQGLYCGFLLVVLYQESSDPAWPRSYSQEMKPLPESPSPITPPPAARDPYPEMRRFDSRRSSLRKFPRRSSRYSGRTLCLQSSPDKYTSLDTTSTLCSPEPSPTREKTPDPFPEADTRPLLRGNGSIRSMPSLRQGPRVQQSLDSLVQPSPSESVETLGESPEQHIHPLFRSTSPSPSPVPTRGTRVQASPSAGQTITKNTLTRMRSAHSLRDPCMRTPSPLSGPEDDVPVGPGLLSFIYAGHVRRNVTQYEKRSELHESPDEK
ncbi:hypothetical protein N7492_002790 [Penicillium capsulatum]|uniref:Uncharacterized protein n=1 Tax=Penicillium capsulatum TaxID=69766 RepID=A0A9W9IM96_9EURO|nr:hypothetical protein N7492_002790 [Penicillium capsulatum]KAJ6122613.1 hypothetical protein N7512_005078 [Penicillium capsulatum]